MANFKVDMDSFPIRDFGFESNPLHYKRAYTRGLRFMFQRDFFKITALYTVGIVVTLCACWLLLGLAMPDAKLDVLQTLTSVFGINLPNDMPLNLDTEARIASVVLIIAVMSIGLVILNVFFSAVITARFIRPRVDLILSKRGVLSTQWNPSMPYVLVRMSNFYPADLVDVTLAIALTVEETHIVDGKEDTFRTYFTIEQFTPQRILVMEQRMPWSIAVPGDILLSNSKTRAYPFRPGKAIVDSVAKEGVRPARVRRCLQILIQGTDARSYSHFVIHKNIFVDEQNGMDYKLLLHKGIFKSLPMRISDQKEIEQYA